MRWVIFIDSSVAMKDLKTDLSVGFFIAIDRLNPQWVTAIIC
ncbi:hypothetical protein [Photobacterium phosphoreum]|nr:hypothetical protein [Photobacterium phosphoreum]